MQYNTVRRITLVYKEGERVTRLCLSKHGCELFLSETGDIAGIAVMRHYSLKECATGQLFISLQDRHTACAKLIMRMGVGEHPKMERIWAIDFEQVTPALLQLPLCLGWSVGDRCIHHDRRNYYELRSACHCIGLYQSFEEKWGLMLCVTLRDMCIHLKRSHLRALDTILSFLQCLLGQEPGELTLHYHFSGMEQTTRAVSWETIAEHLSLFLPFLP